MNDAIQNNIGLVKYIVAQYNPPNDDVRQQLITAGCIGLWKALEAYDPEKYGTQLQTIATPSIRWEILNTLEELESPTVSLSTVREPYYKPKPHIWEYLPDNLTITEKELINLRLDRHTIKEISVLMGRSYITTRRLLAKTFSKVQRANREKQET